MNVIHAELRKVTIRHGSIWIYYFTRPMQTKEWRWLTQIWKDTSRICHNSPFDHINKLFPMYIFIECRSSHTRRQCLPVRRWKICLWSIPLLLHTIGTIIKLSNCVYPVLGILWNQSEREDNTWQYWLSQAHWVSIIYICVKGYS